MTTISQPVSRATVRMSSQNAFQCTLGSAPDTRTRSRTAPIGRAAQKSMLGHERSRTTPSRISMDGRVDWKST